MRYSIYFSGCIHDCFNCHNKETADPTLGTEVDDSYIEKIINEINSNPLLDGITLSGGDPFFNECELLGFLRKIRKSINLNIFVYTGYTYEQLLTNEVSTECLNYIDYLVDGPYIDILKNPTLYFRGSNNQRIIKLVNGKMDSVYEDKEGFIKTRQ